MIAKVTVENFAIIESLSVSFGPDFTVLTGETGAGKSLIVDAISLLLGEKATRFDVRYGSTEAKITGHFTRLTPLACRVLGIKKDEALIERIIDANGTSTSRLNGKAVSLGRLSKAAPLLCDIHNQRGFESVLDPHNYVALLDTDETALEAYKIAYRTENACARDLKSFKEKNNADRERLDFLRYRINELEKASLSSEEENDLKMRSRLVSHHKQVQEALSDLSNALSTTADLYPGMKALETLQDVDPSYDDFKTRFANDYYDLADLEAELDKKKSAFLDADELDATAIDERLGLYADLKRKYGKTVPELVSYLSAMKEERDLYENFDEIVKEKMASLATAQADAYAKGCILHEARAREARKLEDAVSRELKDLELSKTVFRIALSPLPASQEAAKFMPNGLDTCDFLVSFNPGLPPRPLAKVASGGERSRFMLALKAVLKERIAPQTLIFDEIDQGVSGHVASSIARKMQEMSVRAQVLAVTHLPQVAAIADEQVQVVKGLKEGLVMISASSLSLPERVEAIGAMISAGEATSASRTVARELLAFRRATKA